MPEDPVGGETLAQRTDGLEPATLATVARVLQEILEDEVLASEITLQTSFSADLELESIMFVALTERLNERYGESVDFVSWIAGLELEEIMDLTVGDLVEHIDSCLS